MENKFKQKEFQPLSKQKQTPQAHNFPTNEQQNEKSQLSIQIQDENKMNQKLEKLIRFIRFHKIEQSSIWNGTKQITVHEFSTFMNEQYAYNVSNQELSALLGIAHQQNHLSPKDFQSFDIWKVQPENIKNYLSMSNSSRTKKPFHKSSTHLNQTKNSFELISQFEEKQATDCQIHKTKLNVRFPTKPKLQFKRENFQEAKKQSEAKAKIKVESLKKDIKQSVLQKKWDFIVMAGQMNQWINQLKSRAENQFPQKEISMSLCYRYKVLNRDSIEIVQQNVALNTEQRIPHVVFIKKYKTLKKRMVKEQNNKSNLKGTVLMVLEDNDKLNKTNLVNRINQRDQELNFVLLQIMRMKSLFEWQNSVIKQAKINS